MRKILYSLIASTIILPSIAFAANPTTFAELVNVLLGIINALVPLFFLLALIGFIIGIIKYIYSADPKKIGDARSYIAYSLITISVMLSIWGLALLLKNSFFPSSVSSPTCSAAAPAPSLLQNAISQIVQTGNYLIPPLILIAFIGFILGVIKYIFSGDPKKIQDGRRYIVFSVLGMSVILSFFAIGLLASRTILSLTRSNTPCNGPMNGVPPGVDYYPPGTGPTPPPDIVPPTDNA